MASSEHQSVTVLKSVFSRLADHEIWLLVVIVPLLIRSGRYLKVGLVLLLLPWLLRLLAHGRLSVRTPLDWPLGLILIWLPVNVWASADKTLTWPALAQLLAGLTVFWSVVNWVRSEQQAELAAWGLTLLGLELALLAPVGVRWPGSELPFLARVYGYFPLLLDDPINPNVMAGALVQLMPLAGALILPGTGRHRSRLARWGLSLLAAVALLLMGFIVVLTQSQGAYIALAAALLALAVLRSRWFLLIVPVTAAGAWAAWRWTGALPLLDLLLAMPGESTWVWRQEVWSQTLHAVQDFAVTGIGLGTFPRVMPLRYPHPCFAVGSNAAVPHAHNLFLQVAVDLGLPGLIAYLALLVGCFWMVWRVYKSQISNRKSQINNPQSAIINPQSLAAGLWGSLVVLVVHGLTDAMAWSSKPAIIPWAVFGLTAALYRLSGDVEGRGKAGEESKAETGRRSVRSRLGDFPLTLVYWILFSLLAIGFIGNWPYVGLAIALAGGAVLGFFSVMSLEPRRYVGRAQQKPGGEEA
ncbi:MAG: O-antigen ligase family protein [Ardenticatenia bacterium]|nr:O-antigen ligase family protein [Ardenticatenia bacterium]